jgi:hypothetical protein
MYPAQDTEEQWPEHSKSNDLWKNTHDVPGLEMIALHITFGLLLSDIWGRLTGLVAMAIRMTPNRIEESRLANRGNERQKLQWEQFRDEVDHG